MKLKVSLRASILALAIALPAAFPAFSTENDLDSILTSNQAMKESPSRLLFPSEEWTNIQIGYALIEERIREKQEILNFLRNETISLPEKMRCCQRDFGRVPAVSSEGEGIQEGIKKYCTYISSLMDTYVLAQGYAQKIFDATTLEEKNNSQNNLYYFLSCTAKYFRAYTKVSFCHEIPEHSLEDTFYEMIHSKMCESASKDYDILNEYILISRTEGRMEKKIDDKKLYDFYVDLHKGMITTFQKTSPTFWGSSVVTHNVKINQEIKNLFEAEVAAIRGQLQKFPDEIIKISNGLAGHLKSYNEQVNFNPNDNDFVLMYQIVGPWILEAVQSYENVTKDIKKIERDSIQWLKKFKENKETNPFFRKFPAGRKKIINEYLESQDKLEKSRIALEKKQAAAQKAAAQKEVKKVEKKIFPPAQKKTQNKKRETLNLLPEETSSSLITPDESISSEEKPAQEENSSKIIPTEPAQDVSTVPFSGARVTEWLEEKKEETTFPPKVKVKVKTRPAHPVVPLVEEKNEEPETPELPLPYQTEEFTSFIHSLVKATKEKDLKKLFQELNAHGIFAENSEKNNKGYFTVRSPLTGEIHVSTYHHLHEENPYASIFMAARHVLQSAGIIKR